MVVLAGTTNLGGAGSEEALAGAEAGALEFWPAAPPCESMTIKTSQGRIRTGMAALLFAVLRKDLPL
jgi:hypothetical protein